MLAEYDNNYEQRGYPINENRSYQSNEQRSYPMNENRSYQPYEQRGYQPYDQQNRDPRTTVLERGRAVRLMKNGDPFFTGRTFVVNQKKYPMFDVFLDDASRALGANFGAVRCIYTPQHGRRLRDIGDFEDHHTYVASGGEKFKYLNYLDIAEGKRSVTKGQNSPKLQLPPVRRVETEGRAMKLSRSENLIIYVYRNGDPLTLPAKVLLVKSTLQSWEKVLDEVSRKVLLNHTAVLKLYAMNGELITSAHQLEYGGMYVGAGKERFRRIEYPDPKLINIGSSPKALRKSYSKSDGNTTNTTNTNSNGNMGYSGSRRPPREEYEVFNQKPLQHRRGPPKEIDLDRDDGGIYKNRSGYRNRPKEIDDNYDTKVEIPVNHRELQTVDDENLYGNVERTPRRHYPTRTTNHLPKNSKPKMEKSPISQQYDEYNDNSYSNSRTNGYGNEGRLPSRTPNDDDQPLDSSPFEQNEYDYRGSHSNRLTPNNNNNNETKKNKNKTHIETNYSHQ